MIARPHPEPSRRKGTRKTIRISRVKNMNRTMFVEHIRVAKRWNEKWEERPQRKTLQQLDGILRSALKYIYAINRQRKKQGKRPLTRTEIRRMIQEA